MKRFMYDHLFEIFCFLCFVFFSTSPVRLVSAQEHEIHSLPEALSWLEYRAGQQIRECRREMNDKTATYPPQVGLGYNAFWLRDYAYILEGGIEYIPAVDLRGAVRVFLEAQREDGACVDCVKYDGTPIYMPGYGSMGKNPVADGSQFMVSVVYLTWKHLKDNSLLSEKTMERLIKAMKAVPRNSETGLVHIKPGDYWDRCPYGFHDTVRKQGDVFFESLLYVEAAKRLAEMLRQAGQDENAKHFENETNSISKQINDVFWDETLSLYRAATIKCREGDIWGNAFAVWLNVAPSDRADKIAHYFKEHYDGLVFEGQIRMLPPNVYWEQGCGQNSYQNGAYWGTATGWFAWTLRRADLKKAEQTIIDLVNGYRRTNCPEWVFGQKIQLPKYMSSVTLPIVQVRPMVNTDREAENQKE
jgi:hypothetical protein